MWVFVSVWCFLLGGLLIEFCQSQNVRSFSQYIETNQISYTLGASSTSGNLAFSYVRAKNSTDYNYCLAISSLLQQYTSGQYSIALQSTSQSASGMQVMVSTKFPGSISQFRFSYLIVMASFPYMTTGHYIYLSSYLLWSSNGFSFSITLPIDVNSTVTLFPWLVGWDLAQNSYWELGVYLTPTMISANVVEISITNTLTQVCQISSLYVDILSYDEAWFEAVYNSEDFTYQMYQYDIELQYGYYVMESFFTTINAQALMMGIGAVQYVNNDITAYQDPIYFYFELSSDQIWLNIGQNRSEMIFAANLIIMQTSPVCSNSIWNQTANQCEDCPNTFYYDSASVSCLSCSTALTYCNLCSSSATCTSCLYGLVVSGGSCVINCSYNNCISCSLNTNDQITCTACSSGWVVANLINCQTVCGDGIVVGTQQCDDGNTVNGDGCSSVCQIQQYFSCTSTTGSASVCLIDSLTMDPILTVKSEDSNSFTLTVSMLPSNLMIYQNVIWLNAFLNQSSTLSATDAVYDSSTGRLRITFSYGEDLQDLNITVTSTATSLCSQFASLQGTPLSLPANTQNNLALDYYSSSDYSLFHMIKYVSLALSSLALVLVGFGFFGTKLIALECIALYQLSALMMLTQNNMSPPISALTYLSVSMGVIDLSKGNVYEDSNISPNDKALFFNRDSLNCINIFLILFLIPFITGFVLLFLSKCKKFKDSPLIHYAWKNLLGTFSFYGLLFLAYGQFAYLAVNVREFAVVQQSYMGIAIGAIFSVLIAVYLLSFCKFPRWFGLFKNKFHKFSISEYFYLSSCLQRAITAFLIVCLSPGGFAPLIIAVIFLAQGIFIFVKKPYLMETWKRPLANKIGAVIICCLFACTVFLPGFTILQTVVPMIVLGILAISLAYSIYFTVQKYPEHIEEAQLKAKNAMACLTLQKCQEKQIRDFQQKMMPKQFAGVLDESMIQKTMLEESRSKWYWQSYTHLYSMGMGSILSSINPKMMKKDSEGEIKEKQVELKDMKEEWIAKINITKIQKQKQKYNSKENDNKDEKNNSNERVIIQDELEVL